MKDRILEAILTLFDRWSSKQEMCCSRGCSLCCTQKVTVTALEARKILKYCIRHKPETWLTKRLTTMQTIQPPAQTTNEYVTACLNDREVGQDDAHSLSRCPFLEDSICTIYPVRPFSCRCFVSQQPCDELGTAAVPDYYLSASMAVMQIIEHLGQFDHWGNLGDVLLVVCEDSDFTIVKNAVNNPARVEQAKRRVRQALPLSGFLISKEDMNIISPLLDDIFTTRIGHKSIEQILNGQ